MYQTAVTLGWQPIALQLQADKATKKSTNGGAGKQKKPVTLLPVGLKNRLASIAEHVEESCADYAEQVEDESVDHEGRAPEKDTITEQHYGYVDALDEVETDALEDIASCLASMNVSVSNYWEPLMVFESEDSPLRFRSAVKVIRKELANYGRMHKPEGLKEEPCESIDLKKKSKKLYRVK